MISLAPGTTSAMLRSITLRAPSRLSLRALATARRAGAAAVASAAPLPRVVLKGGKSKLFAGGQSPMVYSGAVDRVVGRPTPQAGDAVLLCDGKEEAIGWGFFNPSSMFRVRVMQTADELDPAALARPDAPALVEQRIAAAVALRRALGLPSPATSVYRLINSEGDRLSGLVVDVLGDRLVVSSSAAWVELNKQAICEALMRHAGLPMGAWRGAADMLAEEGWPAGGAAAGAQGEDESAQEEAANEAGAEGEAEAGTSGTVVVSEGGISYAVDPAGQKTGFYCDQRDHRAFVRSVAQGKDVLDLCCYTGGFALSAAAGGAASALGVDSSAPAVALAQRNAELNGCTDRCAFEKGDVAPWMSAAAKEGRQWDIVVLDPPKLAPSRKALTGALRKYESLNASAMRLVRPGGLLMTCSCSGAVRAAHGDDSFEAMLRGAARRARRRVTVVREGSAAPDHTVDPGHPEGRYLTNVLLRVA